MNSGKETVYIDGDDEITGVIDKVRSSNEKIVALVLPKRTPMLQSIVNMKLLKRTADETNKRLVLITSEAGIMPLAGAVGLYVAKTLQSKPSIPTAPKLAGESGAYDANEDIDVPSQSDSGLDSTRPVGELAGLSEDDSDETIELDNDPVAPAGFAGAAAGANKNKARKGLKIPNFENFRLRLILGVAALILLIVGWYVAFTVLPKATVLVKTDNSFIPSEINLTASTRVDSLDEARAVVPAVRKELRKTDTEKVATTGEKDKGKKAIGAVSLKNCSASVEPITIPRGTGVSTGNLTFITTEKVTLPPTVLNGLSQCTTPEEDVSVEAQNAGDKYNLSSGRTFSVSGYSRVSGTNEDKIEGGTSKIVKIVSQQDVTNARNRLQERNEEGAKEEVSKSLKEEGYVSLPDTLQESSPEITSSPNVGDEANEVTITSTITYSMFGVKEDDLNKLVEVSVEGEIDKDKQTILDYGIDKASFKVDGSDANTARLTMQVQVEAGPQLDKDSIKQEILGKKKNEATELIQSRPGIKQVEVSYSPFWVSSVPKNPEKISVTFESGNDEQDDKDE
ncbi:hypothetical protein BH23PAT1_BH23PAT1_1860 [soil metagenome]